MRRCDKEIVPLWVLRRLYGLASLLQFLLNALRFLDILISGILGLTFLLSKGNTVVSLVPGSDEPHRL